MPKTYIPIKLDDEALSIVTKYQQDHGNCNRTRAITDMINAYPLLKVKSVNRELAQRIKDNIPKESIMPDVCKHIDDLDINRDAVHCSLKKAWVKAHTCQTCERREPIDAP